MKGSPSEGVKMKEKEEGAGLNGEGKHKKPRLKEKERKKRKKQTSPSLDGGEERPSEYLKPDTSKHTKGTLKGSTSAEVTGPIVAGTLSIAVSAAVIENSVTLESATALAGQIARAAAVFRAHEVVVFDEPPRGGEVPFRLSQGHQQHRGQAGRGYAGGMPQGGTGGVESPTAGALLARLLQYLDTPQYLRRLLVPMHPDLRYAGTMPPLDAPHQPRSHEWTRYREGAVTGHERTTQNLGGTGKGGAQQEEEPGEGLHSVVEVGLEQTLRVKQYIPVGTRVTVAMGPSKSVAFAPGSLLEAVPPGRPVEEAEEEARRLKKGIEGEGKEGKYRERVGRRGGEEGRKKGEEESKETVGRGMEERGGHDGGSEEDAEEGESAEGVPSCPYWGYTVRLCNGVNAAIRECPYDGGYDLVIGTSERGDLSKPSELRLPRYKHCLVVFGGPRGLEESIKRDRGNLKGETDPFNIFGRYLNTCPAQGSRTIRTEEAVLISLTFLSEPLGRLLT